jgi:hypothetical protein
MIVLGGNMRLKAMKEAGWKEAPVEVVDWDEQKQKEFIIKDNVGFGEWDWQMIAADWDKDELNEWGLEVPAWSKGLDVNSMDESELDMSEEFDPIGISKGLVKLVVIFDNLTIAKDWIQNKIPDLDYKKKGNDDNIILQANLSSNYGI